MAKWKAWYSEEANPVAVDKYIFVEADSIIDAMLAAYDVKPFIWDIEEVENRED